MLPKEREQLKHCPCVLSSCLGFRSRKTHGDGTVASCFKVISLPRAPWCIRAHLRSLGWKPIDPKRYQLEGLWHKYESHIIRFTPMINELVVEPTHLKNIRQNWIISPIFGVKKNTNIWNHHPDDVTHWNHRLDMFFFHKYDMINCTWHGRDTKVTRLPLVRLLGFSTGRVFQQSDHFFRCNFENIWMNHQPGFPWNKGMSLPKSYRNWGKSVGS